VTRFRGTANKRVVHTEELDLEPTEPSGRRDPLAFSQDNVEPYMDYIVDLAKVFNCVAMIEVDPERY
jgi:hypothetical protein